MLTRASGSAASLAAASPAAPRRTFEIILIKPSHYDDDGYVIQWMRSSIPSNSLAVLYGLAQECANKEVLGGDVDIRITAWDETNTRIDVPAIIERIRASGGRGLVGLVGVQSNQFPRAVDIARPLRAAGVQVCIGGFHVSGCLAMLPEPTPELCEAMDLGIALFAGEAEGRLDEIVRAADRGDLARDLQLHARPAVARGRGRPVPAGEGAAPHATACAQASTPGAAAPSCAASARSSTCRGGSRARAARTTSRPSSGRTSRRACSISSSPTTTSRAIATGSRSSTASSRCARSEGMRITVVAQVDTMAHGFRASSRRPAARA